ncbi:Protein of unknown function [Bacillus mycoides]|nr:Protein of unknown function [Bacillus mycoides]
MKINLQQTGVIQEFVLGIPTLKTT